MALFACCTVTEAISSFKNPHSHKIFCAAELMVWFTLEQSLEGTSKFQMKKEGQFIFIMWTYPYPLAAYDIVKQSQIVEFSPELDSRFEKLKQELAPLHSPVLRVLCLTRWSVRAKSLSSVLDNYTILLSLLHDLT